MTRRVIGWPTDARLPSASRRAHPPRGGGGMGRASLAVCFLMAAPSCPDLYSLATHGFAVPALAAPTGTAAPDPGGVRVDIRLTADNPNPFPLSLSGVDYAVALQGQTVFAGSAADPELPEHATGTVDLIGVVDAST